LSDKVAMLGGAPGATIDLHPSLHTVRVDFGF
jgi:hypothetical protein